ncbi:MAG: ClpXP protease specificity-enhancing factor [Rhodospirillaceae bacterium]|nr:ClpXP protease specificity-enhancing factor [Rhodospirillaceae bacterium]
MPQATSKRPYLLRAMHAWMSDNGLTPYIIVDAEAEGLAVPEPYVADGRIVLNVSAAATRDLIFGHQAVRFEARFGGVAHRLEVPVPAVIGIYARETGQGMIFADDQPAPDTDMPGGGKAPGRPALKVVK